MHSTCSPHKIVVAVPRPLRTASAPIHCFGQKVLKIIAANNWGEGESERNADGREKEREGEKVGGTVWKVVGASDTTHTHSDTY